MTSSKKQSEVKDSISTKIYPKWYYFVLMLIPVVIILLLEFFLSIFNYGWNDDQWVELNKEKLTLNPEIARRYFYNTENIPSAGNNFFDGIKKNNAYRVFVLGGSSAAGFPFPANCSFARYIQKRLETVYPDMKLEVVNIAMSAVNSYTLLDILPGVISQKPDLIVIYAGHNEYYGALGVGSVETLGDTRFLVKAVLWLNRFKTFQLLRDLISAVKNLFSTKVDSHSTLMATLSQNQVIPYRSEKYIAGLNQFEGNLRDIFEMTKAAKVPVMIGNLVCNLKDQKPFESVDDEVYPRADEIYKLAEKNLNQWNTSQADSLFRYAKDLDALKWRAPEEINKIITKLGNEFNYPVVKLDSIFNSISPGNIVGDNLITDHLHPNLRGYQLIGKAFCDEGFEKNVFPIVKNSKLSLADQDSITLKNFGYSELDSTYARYQIIIVKSDFPYTKVKKTNAEKIAALNMNSFTDTLAFLLGKSKLGWEEAHLRIAQRKISNHNVKDFINEINIVIAEYPFDPYPFEYATEQLINLNELKDAYPYLLKSQEIKPTGFSSKWLGIINLLNNKVDSAINFLNLSLNYNSSDAQVLYNLAGAYSMKKDYKSALRIINKCLEVNPNYSMAKDLQRQLINAYRQSR